MPLRAIKSAVGPLAAVVFAFSILAYQHHRQYDPHVRFDRFQLPSYDAYAYVAMAESPSFFTVAPWGYRLLTPLVVHALPGRNSIRGFLLASVAGLTLGALFLFLFLRRLGHGSIIALAAVTFFCLSPPAADAVLHGINTDALAALLLAAFLYSSEACLSLSPLCLLAALGVLCKEINLVVVPLVFFVSRDRHGTKTALLKMMIVALPAAAVAFTLRYAWAPRAGGTILPGVDQIPAAISLTVEQWREWWRPILLWGLTPLALIGALRKNARRYLARYGFAVAALGMLPFVSAVYGGGAELKFLSGDIPRLTLYPLLVWLPLALEAFGRFAKRRPAPPASRLPRPIAGLFFVTTLGVLCGLPFMLDPYRRADLRGSRDGPLLLALCRESPRVARRLERNRSVTFSPETHAWAWKVSDAPLLNRMRWFLREGFGDLPHYGVHAITMREREARIILPCLRPRDIEIRLDMIAHEADVVKVVLKGRIAGAIQATTTRSSKAIRIPAALLFRGDNVITLRRERDGVPGPRLLRLTYTPMPGR
ncbi:MAG: hypothetical protein JXO72_00075 [Vicinamibacteria bacterium]|nr:hypothetical protein [Vicinamibacteria bacterium]